MGTVQNFLKIFNTRGRFAFVVFLFAILILPVSAQAVAIARDYVPAVLPPLTTGETTVVATVNVQDLVMLKQDKNAITIGFNISNREGVQPKIIYAVQLLSVNAEKQPVDIVDQKIYTNDIVTLGNNDSVKKVVTYVAPSYLKGSYLLFVEAQNNNGLPLGMVGTRDTITLNGTGEYIKIDQSDCNITVDGEKGDKTYTLSQGVDISAGETLTAHCSVTNTFSTEQTVTPTFQTYYRSSFGKLVGTIKSDALTLKPNQKTTFTAKLPKPTEPQSYDSVLTFMGKKDTALSPSIAFHYVIRGASATLQNLTIDKDYYQTGDTVKVMFFWTGGADNFGGSRGGDGDTSKTLSAKFTITDDQKNACIVPFDKTLDNVAAGGLEQLSLPITRECKNPTISAQIIEQGGKVLADNTYDITSKNVPVSESENKSSLLLVSFLILAIIVALIFYMVVKKKRTGLAVMFGVMIGLGTLFGGGGEARADTWTVTFITGGGHHNYVATIVSTLDKKVYSYGESIHAISYATNATCANNDNVIDQMYINTKITINGETKSVIGTRGKSGKLDTTFTAQTWSGSWDAVFKTAYSNGGNKYFTGTHNIPYSVKNNAKAITGFSFANFVNSSGGWGIAGVIDETAKTITIEMPQGGTSFPAGVWHTGKSVSPISLAENNFLTSKTYTVTAEDDSTQVYTIIPIFPKVLREVVIVENGAHLAIATPGNGGINEAAKTVTLNVPFGSSPNHRMVNTHSGVSISPLNDTLTTSNNFTYTVTAADGKIAVYTVTITTLACVPQAWSPNENGTCNTTTLTQTNGCPGGTRVIAGTAVCNIPQTGAGGSACGKTYASSVTGYGSDTQCSIGNPSNTAFPTQGGNISWTCSGLKGGGSSGVCSASRLLSSDKDIISFNFTKSDNPALLSTIVGTISGTGISLTVPFGTNLATLIPSITVSPGASISPLTGVAKDFTSPVLYKVTAADTTTKNYTVTVTVAPNNDKDIISFNFTKSNNPTLTATVIGTINQGTKTIVLKVRYGTNVTALIPTITHTGASISPVNLQARNFKNPVVYTVTDAIGGTQAYTVAVTKVNSFNFVEF